MRLIDADALKENINKFIGYLDEDMIYRIKVVIDNSQTIEPYCYFCGQEVHGIRPQGEWIIDKDTIFGTYSNYRKCSICNEDAEWLDGGSQLLSNFCPNCGAKIQKGGDEK